MADADFISATVSVNGGREIPIKLPTGDQIEDKGSIASQDLRLFVERVERLHEEKKGLEDDIKDVFGEMKGRGYDTKIVKRILAIRRKKKGEHQEEEMLLETYMAALGMI